MSSILVDENLSFRVIPKLADILPDLHHVKSLQLTGKPDTHIWAFAAKQGFAAILTADIDFQNKALELGPPPKVIRIEHYDFPTKELAALIRRDLLRITEFLSSPNPLLVLRR